MKISLDLELKDIPGQLVKALEPISKYGGNIVSVVHLREGRGKGNRVPVHIIFEIDDQKGIDRITNDLERRDIWISKIGRVKRKEKIVVMIIGHVVDTDIRDTIDKINEIEGVMVADLSLTMPHPDQETSAIMDIEVDSLEKAKAAIARLGEIAEEKDLLVVKSLGV
ncbi:MAG: ACT domain-containing protein [Candidatus Hydrothermarchaeales archaeon]